MDHTQPPGGILPSCTHPLRPPASEFEAGLQPICTPLPSPARESTMASTTTKPPPKNSKRKKKSQPVTSGSKPGTPGPSTSVNLNLPLDPGDSSAKAGSGPDPTPVDFTSQSTLSSSSSSRPQTGEPEAELVLNVIGTPALPSHFPTPAPTIQPESTARTSAATPYPIHTPLPPSPTMLKIPESIVQAPFGVNEEFIAFAFPTLTKRPPLCLYESGIRGNRDNDVEKRGKKRKSGEISRDDREYDRDGRRDRGRDRDRDRGGDRYGEKRQRMENVPRCAPWIANVDWDRCANVAEL
jgi:hypothetical protein